MNDDAKLKLGATPGKLCLVAALGIVLIIVLLSNESSELGSTATQPRPKPTASHQKPNSSSRQASIRISDFKPNGGAFTGSAKWKTMTLEDALLHDPFGVSSVVHPPVTKDVPQLDTVTHQVSAPTEAKEAEQDNHVATLRMRTAKETMRRLEQRGASMVFRGGQQWLAIIGDKTVRVGDVLGDFQVVEIRPDGVVIEQPRQEMNPHK